MRPALWHRNNFAIPVSGGIITATAPTLYQFDNVFNSWTSEGATLTNNATFMTVSSTSIDPIIRRTVNISGLRNPYIQINIRRTAGATWDGKVFYSTAGHAESALFYKDIPQPTWDGTFKLITLDMRTLTIGGSDWTDNTITNVRLDFGASTLDVFDIDFIVFRGDIYPVAGLYQYQQAGYYADNVNFFTSMVAVGPTEDINTTLAATTTSYQYLGHFLATATGVYRFGIASDDAGYLWVGSTASSGFSTSNALIAQPGLRGAAYSYSRLVIMQANTYYPIRFMTGNNQGAGGQFLVWSYQGGAFVSSGIGEYFYNADTGGI